MYVPRFLFRIVLLAAVLFSQAANAATLLRDPDIENSLQKLANPILRAAGLGAGSVKILLVDDRRLNAFVIDRSHIFIHSGLISKLETASQLQAVIAHEAAHIANGHITRRIANAQSAQRSALFGMLLAAAVAAGGNGEAAAGIAAGGFGSARGVFLGHTRAEESSADQSALSYLRRAKIPPASMAEVFGLFKGQEALNVGRRDPYAQTHPMNRDRIRAIKGATAGEARIPENKEFTYWYARAKAKLNAFQRAPKWTLRRAKGSSQLAVMQQAIAHHRQSKGSKAQSLIAQLVKAYPKDAYFRELQGQILLEGRQFKNAVAAYGQAVRLAPNNALILGGYGRALLTLKTPANDKKALDALIKARSRDSRDARILRDLGTAYARNGKPGFAALAAAERYALRGDLKNAKIQARRAAARLPVGTKGRQRALDILGNE